MPKGKERRIMIGRYEGFAKSYFKNSEDAAALKQLKEYIKENLFNVSDISDAVAWRFNQLSQANPHDDLKNIQRFWLAVQIMREERMTEEAKAIFIQTKRLGLLLACYGNYGELVKKIHGNGVSLKVEGGTGNYTPLHHALTNGNEELARWMIDKGAEVDGKLLQSHWTPLHFASNLGFKEIVRQLLRANADANSLTNIGDSPIYLATDRGHHGVVGELVKAGAKNLDGREGVAKNPMHLAAFKKDARLVIKLALSGADPSIVDWEEKKPIERLGRNSLETAFSTFTAKLEDKNPFASISRDVPPLIFQYLPLSAKLNVRAVCRAWNHYVVQHMISEFIRLSSKAPD